MKSRLKDIEPYLTKDGSTIKELLHPNQSATRNQSLAEATVPVGITTHLHKHHITEEIYHITGGRGEMILGSDQFPVSEGDSILIPPGTAHAIKNIGDSDLVLLCCCSPAYSHEDTELL